MPVFHFHLHERNTSIIDDDGVELRDFEAAVSVAIAAARDVMASDVKAGQVCLNCHIDITNEQGESLGHISFREAVCVSG